MAQRFENTENIMKNTVLILGARGRLGGALAQAFAAAGWRVLAQRRSGGKVLSLIHISEPTRPY